MDRTPRSQRSRQWESSMPAIEPAGLLETMKSSRSEVHNVWNALSIRWDNRKLGQTLSTSWRKKTCYLEDIWYTWKKQKQKLDLGFSEPWKIQKACKKKKKKAEPRAYSGYGIQEKIFLIKKKSESQGVQAWTRWRHTHIQHSFFPRHHQHTQNLALVLSREAFGLSTWDFHTAPTSFSSLTFLSYLLNRHPQATLTHFLISAGLFLYFSCYTFYRLNVLCLKFPSGIAKNEGNILF